MRVVEVVVALLDQQGHQNSQQGVAAIPGGDVVVGW